MDNGWKIKIREIYLEKFENTFRLVLVLPNGDEMIKVERDIYNEKNELTGHTKKWIIKSQYSLHLINKENEKQRRDGLRKNTKKWYSFMLKS